MCGGSFLSDALVAACSNGSARLRGAMGPGSLEGTHLFGEWSCALVLIVDPEDILMEYEISAFIVNDFEVLSQ